MCFAPIPVKNLIYKQNCCAIGITGKAMKIGDYIYYTDSDGNTYPGKVVKVFKTPGYIRVYINHTNGNFERVVKTSNCELQ